MTSTVVDDARRRLGRIGAGLIVPIAPADEWRRAVGRLETAGYGAVWINEAIGGREAFAQLGVLLAASERLVAGTGIANLWARHPAAMQGGAAVLADAYPGRVVLGVGVSAGSIVEASGQKWDGRPLRRMREYLDAMDASAAQAPTPRVPFPRVVAALGPKMLELAAERADGAMTASLPVEHTRTAREFLGPDKLLVVGQLVVPETDPGKARATARQITGPDPSDSPYDKALKRMGYGDEDIAGGGTDELIDERVPWGTPDAIAEKLAAHLDAGADHVSVFVLAPDLATMADRLERLAPALLKIG